MRINIKHIILLLLCCSLQVNVMAQDPHFSQFYASPLYLSPSFAGSTDGGRLILNYRNQWPGVEKAFQTSAVSFDNFFTSINSGIGVLFYQDIAGSAGLTTNNLSFQYSYNVIINEHLQMVPGLQITYGDKSINFNKLEFGNDGSNSLAKLNNDRTNYMDFAASLLFYSPRFWFGYSIDHLAQPNYTFLNEEVKLKHKHQLYGGVNIWNLNRRNMNARSFSFTYRYEIQQENSQLDLGVYWYNDPIELGVWYRGVPYVKNNTSSINHDAIVALVSYNYGPFRIGYSYDITISSLGLHSQGAHELSLIYEFNQKVNLRLGGRRPAVPCSETANPLSSTGSKYNKKRRRIY
ncbi:PorP/SprF family type IX secretion system membrane protein [bacterium]|nr:PorP/SprF family type IX secretion system membrane protein [bacterium]